MKSNEITKNILKSAFPHSCGGGHFSTKHQTVFGEKKQVYNQFYLTVSDLNVAGSCSFAAMKRDGELFDEFAVRKDMCFFRPSNFESPTVKGNFFPGR